MSGTVRRISRDLRQRRHLDAYVVAAAAFCLAGLSLVEDVVGDSVRWAAVLAALSLLVYRITVPETARGVEEVLQDRSAFDGTTFASRLKGARQLWVFAPSAVNVLGAATADDLRRTILARPDGVIRVVLLDPDAGAAVDIAARQLDDGLDFPVQDLRESLSATEARLRAMSGWQTPGRVEHRYASYNPGFSLVAVDPHAKHGVVIVEVHGVHNTSTGNRMHVELRPGESPHWFEYWVEQYERVWEAARKAEE